MKKEFDKTELQNKFWQHVDQLGAISRKKDGNRCVTCEQFDQVADAIAESFDLAELTSYIQIVAAMKNNDLKSLCRSLNDLKESSWYISSVVKFPTEKDDYYSWRKESSPYNKREFNLDVERENFIKPYFSYLAPIQQYRLSRFKSKPTPSSKSPHDGGYSLQQP